MWVLCGCKINILPTSCQYIVQKDPIYYPVPHFLNGVIVETMLAKFALTKIAKPKSGQNVGTLLRGC